MKQIFEVFKWFNRALDLRAACRAALRHQRVLQKWGELRPFRRGKRVNMLVSVSWWAFLLVLVIGTFAFVIDARGAVSLPIEVNAESSDVASVTVDVGSRYAGSVRSLWAKIHGLEFPDMASVQINASSWFPINNESVTVAEPARSYGGIGGGFSTVRFTLCLPTGTVVGGSNLIRFRFNGTDGVVSGYRVLAFNFVTEDGKMACSSNAFVQEDPSAWIAPLHDAQSIAVGKALWGTARLRSSSLSTARPIRAHCSDCHARDGRDLKYFNFSNRSIIARSRFHGLSWLQGEQIASYIRSLKTSNPGRPWDPPYQPGPELDKRPVSDWAAGAGLAWVIDRDEDTLFYVFAQKEPDRERRTKTDTRGLGLSNLAERISPIAFRPDGDLNPREIPISLQLPDWNHWLPKVHPLDAWGNEFLKSDFWHFYEASKDNRGLRSLLASRSDSKPLDDAEITRKFGEWSLSRVKLLKRPIVALSTGNSSELAQKIYSTQLWQLVKAWELAQEFNLEGSGKPGEKPRGWLNSIPAETAPATTGIPDGPNGMGGSALVNEYFDNSWYELQLLLNSGNHKHTNKRPIDWVYFLGRFLELQKESNRPEAGRVMVSIIKALQSTDPSIGPRDVDRGWRPAQGISPTIMVSPIGQTVFQSVPVDIKRDLIDAMLEAWLEKNTQYPIAQYFDVGRVERTYRAPTFLGSVTGEQTWKVWSQFREAGVRPQLIRRLMDWETAYSDASERFSY